MDKLDQALRKLKKLDLDKFHTNLWIIKRESHGRERATDYDPLLVTVEDKVRLKLRQILGKAISSARHASPYEYMTGDLDVDSILSVNVHETDMEQIVQKIRADSGERAITSATEMFDAWAYLIHATDGTLDLFAVRKTPPGWSLREIDRYIRLFIQDRVAIDLDEKPVFRLEKKLDFVAFDDRVFILDKSGFERTMNFRTGMEKSRDEVLQELAQLKIVDQPQHLAAAIQNKLGLLRRIASIKKLSLYKRPGFVAQCREVAVARGWGVTFKGNQMLATPDNAELVLRLLDNDRLTSLVTDDDYDVDSKRKVARE